MESKTASQTKNLKNAAKLQRPKNTHKTAEAQGAINEIFPKKEDA